MMKVYPRKMKFKNLKKLTNVFFFESILLIFCKAEDIYPLEI